MEDKSPTSHSDAQKAEHVKWLLQPEVHAKIKGNPLSDPFIDVYYSVFEKEYSCGQFVALVPLKLIPQTARHWGWDIHMGDGCPDISTSWPKGKEARTYLPTGREDGIEVLAIGRNFYGMREDLVDLSQEFRLFHNLYHEPSNNQYIKIDDSGSESIAARYSKKKLEVRTDLLREFCAAKQMALAVYIDSKRLSYSTLDQLNLKETSQDAAAELYNYHFSLSDFNSHTLTEPQLRTLSIVTGKTIILPGEMPPFRSGRDETYPAFIIGTDAQGKHISYSCDPSLLSNSFEKKNKAPSYLTPVFFKTEVLNKYYSEPHKYTVSDGNISCGYLWGFPIDNDHKDYVMAYLGDLGEKLPEAERPYWQSYNIPPEGRGISKTRYTRDFLVQFTDPQKPDLLFKSKFTLFNIEFKKQKSWEFFLPLHKDDEHFWTTLRLPAERNLSEFDSQLISLSKILIDSLNEAEIAKGLCTLVEDDKGIAKLEKFFIENKRAGYQDHIKFLRTLQGLRSSSAAHRKGSKYEHLIEDLGLKDEGTQKVFTKIFQKAISFIDYIETIFLLKSPSNS